MLKRTPTPQADGFELDILRRLKMVKDAEKSSLLTYAVNTCKSTFGENFCTRMKEELNACGTAREVGLRNLQAEMSKFMSTGGVVCPLH